MKRIPLILLVFALLLPAASVRADAETARYAVADAQDVWFYAEPDEKSGLFLIPYTYYVRVLSEGPVYCAAEYLDDSPPYRKITGYCKRDKLTFVDFVPERPYLRRVVTLTYTLSDSPALGVGKGAFNAVSRDFVYYGACYAGTLLYWYVYADGIFDYVPAPEDLVYDLNTDYLVQAGPAEPAEPAPEGLSPAHIAVICLLCVAAALLAVFILRGKKPSPAPEEAPEF